MLTRAQVFEELRKVIDPELGINILDLGLVYRVEVSEEAIEVDFTLTYPGCPLGDTIREDIERTLGEALRADATTRDRDADAPTRGRDADASRYARDAGAPGAGAAAGGDVPPADRGADGLPAGRIRARLVWEPVWGPQFMSEEARVSLGFPI
jgi:metal-sulfur cluster biosynthetic enzyme